MLNTNTGSHLGDFLHDPLDCLEDGGLLQQQHGVRLDPVSLKKHNFINIFNTRQLINQPVALKT